MRKTNNIPPPPQPTNKQPSTNAKPKNDALPPHKTKEGSFRQRRLSVTEMDASIRSLTPANTNPNPRRARRMSMSPEMGVIKKDHLLPFPTSIVGTYSCHGVEPGSDPGMYTAKINQDRGCVVFPYGRDADSAPYHQALFCVYDGHGLHGDRVSQYAMNNVQEALEDHEMLRPNPGEAMRRVFLDVDHRLQKEPTIDSELSGTTAVVILMRWAKRQGATKTANVWIANVGDSRAILAQSASRGSGGSGSSAARSKLQGKDLTVDQKPDHPVEHARILKAGGVVSPPEEEWGGPARVWVDKAMTAPGLAMGRSIGDHLVAKVGVIAEPEITSYELRVGEAGRDLFIVMASDGVWEFIETQPVVDIVHGMVSGDATESCTRLIQSAAERWREEEGDYRDDITAICIKLPELLDYPDEDS